MNRFAAMHDWPLLSVLALTAVDAAAATSALGRTTNGSLPPSSSTTFLSCRPAALTREEFFGVLRIIAAHRCALLRFGRGGTDRLSHLERHQLGKTVFLGFENLGTALHQRGALRERRLSPARKRARGERDLCLNFGSRELRKCPKALARRWIDGFNCHLNCSPSPKNRRACRAV